MRFGAQRYELKRSIANFREWLRTLQRGNPTSREYQTSNALVAPSPTHTTTVQSEGQVFNIYSKKKVKEIVFEGL